MVVESCLRFEAVKTCTITVAVINSPLNNTSYFNDMTYILYMHKESVPLIFVEINIKRAVHFFLYSLYLQPELL